MRYVIYERATKLYRLDLGIFTSKSKAFDKIADIDLSYFLFNQIDKNFCVVEQNEDGSPCEL